MNRIIKIEVNIENEINFGLRCNADVTNMIFTDFNSLMGKDELIDNFKQAYKAMSGFSTLTFTLYSYEEGCYNCKTIERSDRYVQRYGEIKRLSWLGNKFGEEVEAHPTLKTFTSLIECYVHSANDLYIKLIKAQVA